MMTLQLRFIGGLALFSFYLYSCMQAYALDSDEKNHILNHILTIGSGVANPSTVGTFRENPAGMIYNKSSKFMVGLMTGFNRPDLLGSAFQFFTGNNLVGATLGVQSFNNAADDKGSISYLNFGMATVIQGLNMSIGFDGAYRFRSQQTASGDDTEKTWAGNLGILYNPFGGFRVGAMIYDLSEKRKVYSFGLATDINDFSVLVIDSGVNDNGQGLTIKPGIGVLVSPFQITYSYGFRMDSSKESGITKGNTIGLGYELTPTLDFQIYYNHVVDYFLALKFKF